MMGTELRQGAMKRIVCDIGNCKSKKEKIIARKDAKPLRKKIPRQYCESNFILKRVDMADVMKGLILVFS